MQHQIGALPKTKMTSLGAFVSDEDGVVAGVVGGDGADAVDDGDVDDEDVDVDVDGCGEGFVGIDERGQIGSGCF